jgi:hypothetical protein
LECYVASTDFLYSLCVSAALCTKVDFVFSKDQTRQKPEKNVSMQAFALSVHADCPRFPISPDHARRLIQARNKDFFIIGFDGLTPDELWAEFACEYTLFKRRFKRAPVTHLSDNGVWYTPKEVMSIYLENGAYHCVNGSPPEGLALMRGIVKHPTVLALPR